MLLAVIIIIVILYIVAITRSESYSIMHPAEKYFMGHPAKPLSIAYQSSPEQVIPAIPIETPVEQRDIEDEPALLTDVSGAAPVSLNYDAMNARRALLSNTEKRAYQANAHRTARDWAAIYEQEFNQCEHRDWWDDIDYVINDSGITP